jgi:predicted transcriptional regulator
MRRILQIPCADPPIRPVSTRKPPKLPKSTVSSSLNSLHQKGVIRKVKKGRENLIRLVQSPGDMSDD